MIIISILAALFSSMNIWTVKRNDMRFHLNDVYMALLMTSWMVVLGGLYEGYKIQIICGSFGVLLFIYMIRNQIFIDKTQFMRGMIPHHSMAILMAENIRKKTSDKDVIILTNNIIASQKSEIDYMKSLGY